MINTIREVYVVLCCIVGIAYALYLFHKATTEIRWAEKVIGICMFSSMAMFFLPGIVAFKAVKFCGGFKGQKLEDKKPLVLFSIVTALSTSALLFV